MKNLLLIRHGSTAGNLERRYIGRTDEPLCEQGIAQLQPLEAAHLQADLLFVSPARRTVQTAQLLFPEKEQITVPGLWETNFGIFEAKTGDELWESSQEYRDWVNGNCLGPVPGGESTEEFKARCCAAFLQCAERVPEGQTAAFVIHGGCIMAILERFARPQKSFYDYHVPNGACVRCTLDRDVITI